MATINISQDLVVVVVMVVPPTFPASRYEQSSVLEDNKNIIKDTGCTTQLGTRKDHTTNSQE